MLSIKLSILSLLSILALGSVASAQGLPVISSDCAIGETGNTLQIFYGGPVVEFPRDVLKWDGKEYKTSNFDQVGTEVIYQITTSTDMSSGEDGNPQVSFSQKTLTLKSLVGPIFDGSATIDVPAQCNDVHGAMAL